MIIKMNSTICKNDELCNTIVNIEMKGFKILSIEQVDGTKYEIMYEGGKND